jgi:hypothetical protein
VRVVFPSSHFVRFRARVLAAKIDESSGENFQDFAVRTQPNFAGSSRRVVTPSLVPRFRALERSRTRLGGASDESAARTGKGFAVRILDPIRHKFVWSFGSLLSRETYSFLSRVGRFPFLSLRSFQGKPNFAGSSRRVVLVTRAVARRGPETKQGRKQCPEGNMDITREETMADWRGSWIYAACTLCMEGNFDHQYPCIVYGRPTYLAGLYFREHMCINVCPETYYILGSQPLGFGTVLMSFVNSFSLKNHTHKE